MTLQRLLILLLSLTPVLLAGLIWNLSIDDSPVPTSRNIAQNNLPDAVLGELVFNQFDEAGNLVQQLVSTRATSYTDGSQIELEEPRLFVTATATQAHWTASSHSGSIDRPGSQLELRGDVELQRLGDAPALLQTETLFWLPASATAYSNDQVIIDVPGSHFESLGISIDLERASFMSHSQVRGTHELL